MVEIKQSTATVDLVFYMVDETDGYTPETGLSPTVVISKNGGSFASPAGSVSEIGNGFYKVAANATDSNTLGILALYATATGASPVAMGYAVVANIESDTMGRLGAPAGASIAADIATADSIADSILTDTGTTLPATLAAIKAKTDLLSGGTVTVQSAVSVSGSAITARAGDSWSFTLLSLGDISARSKLWFVAKDDSSAPDASSQVFIEATSGLTVLHRRPHSTTSQGSITVDDEAAGDISIAVDEAATEKLAAFTGGTWAVKMRDTSGDVTTLATGTFAVTESVIDATS